MFTAELKINGCLVGVLYGHNEGDIVSEPGVCEYHYHYHDIEGGEVLSGDIKHLREAGLRSLVGKILR